MYAGFYSPSNILLTGLTHGFLSALLPVGTHTPHSHSQLCHKLQSFSAHSARAYHLECAYWAYLSPRRGSYEPNIPYDSV